MPSIAVDAGPLIALFDRNDRHSAKALAYFKKASGEHVTNIAVITEVSHLLDFSSNAVQDFLGWARTALIIDQHTASDLHRIIEIMAKYADLPADFADASLLAMCERLGLDHIATLDSDFDVYRLDNGRPLVNVMAAP